MTMQQLFEFARIAIPYLSFIYFPAAVLLLWMIVKSRRRLLRVGAASIFTALTLIAYGRFVEPRLLVTAEHDIVLKACFAEAGAMRLAVFSDLHISPYRYAVPLDRVVNQVNAAKPDVVLIAGDFVSYLPPEKFDETFAALGDIEAPVYAVLGNHDLGLPGPDVAAPLRDSLERSGVAMMDNRAADLSGAGFDVELVGLSDLWARNQRLDLLNRPAAKPRLVLTHNPETMAIIPVETRPDLLIAGHTHGGQVNLPFLTYGITFACRIARYGYREAEHGAVFVTSGTGQSMLPVRFRVPPRIDILNIKHRKCAGDPAIKRAK